MGRTYLYVDGENFTIRSEQLAASLVKDPDRIAQLRALANRGISEADLRHMNPQGALRLWAPEPHMNAVHDQKTAGGLLYEKGELYWDSLGLYVALSAGLLSTRGQNQSGVDRAFYYSSTTLPRIKQYQHDLHAMGFTPIVSQRVKQDTYGKEMLAKGVTVISRPKPMDIQLAVQVLEDCVADNFDRCIFFGGDRDYVPLLDAVRRRGKEVWLIAIEKWLPEELRFACDRFVAYDPVLSVRPLPSPPDRDALPPAEARSDENPPGKSEP